MQLRDKRVGTRVLLALWASYRLGKPFLTWAQLSSAIGIREASIHAACSGLMAGRVGPWARISPPVYVIGGKVRITARGRTDLRYRLNKSEWAAFRRAVDMNGP